VPLKSVVHYYSSRRSGPEADLEDAVVENAHTLFHVPRRLTCILGSLRIGNGLPDLTIIRCKSDVRVLSDLTHQQTLILGYMRAVNRVSAKTLADRLQLRKAVVETSLSGMADKSLIRGDLRSYQIAPRLRDVVDQIISVEAKCNNWKRAVAQAVRNTVFANLSYVALPEAQAIRARDSLVRQKLGIGIISINSERNAQIYVRARAQTSLLWRYYFDLASEAARSLNTEQ
jgi:hypothetical protein